MADLKQIDLNGTTYDLKDSRVDNLSPSTDTIGSTVRGIYINNGELTATSYDVPTTYAGSSSAGGAATSANKVNAAVTFAASGGASAGTTFDGSAAKTISYATVGAAASSHSHAFADLTSRPSYAGATMTGSTAIPEVKTATWDGKSVVSGVASGGNWTSITINGTTNNIPAGGSGGTTKYLHSIVLTYTEPQGPVCVSFTIMNTTSTAYTTIAGIAGALTASKKYACTGYMHGQEFDAEYSSCPYTYELNMTPVFLLKNGSGLDVHAYASDANDSGCGISIEYTINITDWTVSDTVM